MRRDRHAEILAAAWRRQRTGRRCLCGEPTNEGPVSTTGEGAPDREGRREEGGTAAGTPELAYPKGQADAGEPETDAEAREDEGRDAGARPSGSSRPDASGVEPTEQADTAGIDGRAETPQPTSSAVQLWRTSDGELRWSIEIAVGDEEAEVRSGLALALELDDELAKRTNGAPPTTIDAEDERS